MTATAGTTQLLKLALRRDRVMLPAWVYVLTATAVGTAYSTKSLYDTVAARRDFALGIDRNPANLALEGRVFDANSIGAISVWKIIVTGAAMVAVMSLLLVIRHTRADEESGRLELVSAGVLGRSAALGSALLTAFTANLVLFVPAVAGLIAVGLPVAGSVVFGLCWLATGMMFAAVAALTAQATESGRTANGLALSVLGVSFLLRAFGDAAGHDGPSWLSWLSPLGWTEQLRPYAGDRWWVLALPVAFIVVCLGAAFTLVGRRDLGAGLIPPRLGPAEAAATLSNHFALAWRLQRGVLLAWTVGFAVSGAALGSEADSVGSLVGNSRGTQDLLRRMGGHSGMVDAFLSTAMGILALLASAYAVQAVLRLRAEETGQRAEAILATRVGRVGWASGHAAIALLGSTLLMLVGGLMAGLVHGARGGDMGTRLPHVLWSAIVQLPAVWVLAAITIALFGLVPRFVMAGWGVLAVFLLLGQLGPVLRLKQWAMDISPFTHVPKLPGAEMRFTPVVWLVVVAAALTAAGLTGFRRRDLG
jgi:ABC-2 type transport system permease protein